MRARDLVKWKRALNEIKFKHEELSLVKEICDDHGVDFQRFMDEYCAKNNIDLEGLNHKRSAAIAEQQVHESQAKEIEDKKQESLTHLHNPPVQSAPVVEEIDVESNDKDEMHKTFKDLFKKLALNLHPARS